MPQLNPDPWFIYFFLTWSILLLLSIKILKHINLNEPNSQNKKMTNFTWSWPWQ
uniref:ATP synthase complex subunit 8 n=1 Tax=Amolops ricketti TaxID=110104 RepID=X2DWB7_AMORI|nr:ATP synthase F0 subunit 8 [Amolops ricketti]AHL84093.1 ATP synthase F0 subunit 8 [Amolops ricketti]